MRFGDGFGGAEAESREFFEELTERHDAECRMQKMRYRRNRKEGS